MPRNLNTFKMKKVLLSALAVFAFGVANAQEEGGFGFSKGDVLVEGNLTVTSNSVSNGSSTTTTTSYGFAPVGGYFIADKFAVGLGLDITSDKNEPKYNNVTYNKLDNFGVGLFGRYYFLELGQRFKAYGQATLGFNSVTASPTRGDDSKFTEIGFKAGLGLNYFLTRNLAINFALSDVFSVVNNKTKGADGSNTDVTLNVNSFSNFFDTPTFGLTFKF